jgi:hypothetical protein
MSKGSKQRPTDLKAFGSNYDTIFRKPDPRRLEEAKLEDEEFERLDKQSQDSYNKQTEETK